MTEGSAGLMRHMGMRSATALVVANVIGAGVFTTTGFQAADLGHPGIILLLWLLGGVLAYCGALCFAELGAAMPHAGAEYVYLRETYGRPFGYMSAFVSLLAGFSAPIAAAVKSLIGYLNAYFPALPGQQLLLGSLTVADVAAVAVVWLLVAIQLRGRNGGVRFTDAVTALKVGGIVGIIVAAAAWGRGDLGHLTEVAAVYSDSTRGDVLTAMATSLIFVMFCYSGWNAAAYVASEIVEPQQTLPRALLTGTGIVTVLYLLLNVVYFY
ncbi:MAG: amino acid permease, partial [Gammaproteobacteria bacterium]|nr:amino acid permease [Gammaproteobacteria bacterium]